MAGTVNIFFRAEAALDGTAISVGNLSRPKTITLTTGIKFERDYVLSNGATATKVFDEADFDAPALVIFEWEDGPVEISWGADSAAASSDTSSFVSNDAVGGWFILWGSGQNSHEGEAVSDRNSVDGGGSDVGIQEVWMTQKSGAAINVTVTAFK